MSAAAPALAVTVPADQSTSTPASWRTSEAANVVATCAVGQDGQDQGDDKVSRQHHSHSIVAGGLDEMS